MDRDRVILERLIGMNLRPGLDLDELLASLRASRRSLIDFVFLKELADDDELAQVLADHYHARLVRMRVDAIDVKKAQTALPKAYALLQRVVAIRVRTHMLDIAVEDPIAPLETIGLMGVATPVVHVAPRSWMSEALRHVYGPAASNLVPTRRDSAWRGDQRLDTWTEDIGLAEERLLAHAQKAPKRARRKSSPTIVTRCDWPEQAEQRTETKLTVIRGGLDED